MPLNKETKSNKTSGFSTEYANFYYKSYSSYMLQISFSLFFQVSIWQWLWPWAHFLWYFPSLSSTCITGEASSVDLPTGYGNSPTCCPDFFAWNGLIPSRIASVTRRYTTKWRSYPANPTEQNDTVTVAFAATGWVTRRSLIVRVQAESALTHILFLLLKALSTMRWCVIWGT